MNTLLKVLKSNFRKLVMELESARSHEVPTYAPRAFNKALEYYRLAQQEFDNFGSPEEVNKFLEQGFETLDKARVAAEYSKNILSEVVEKRSEINKKEKVRHQSPKNLNEAEQAYREAIELAEEGKHEGACKFAATALNLYRNAKLSALEGGFIKNLNTQLHYTKEWLKSETHDEALAILSSLQNDLKRAKAGDLDTSLLTNRIVVAGNKLDLMLRLNIGFGLNDFLDLSDRVFYPPPPSGLAPGTNEPPTAPVTMRITDRTADTLTITWRNIPSNAEANIVQRREDGGPWEEVAELDVLGEWQSYTDSVGLQPDQPYRYRIVVKNTFGFRATTLDNQAVGYTRDGNNLTVGRIQLRIRVADISDGGSSDPVSVRLNSPLATYSPSGNNTWLDYGPDYSFQGGSLQISDDFDRGREFTYDLNLASIKELSDITMISFKKEGSYAIAIAELALIVNGTLVFDRFFGETSTTAIWVDEYFTISHLELRTNSNWPTSFPIPNFQITNQELVDRLEGIIGDQIHGTKLYWGGRDGSDWVEVTHVNASTLHVTVDLKAEVLGPNPEANIEFDVNVAIVCSETAATLMVTTSNFDVDVSYSIIDDILTVGVVEFFDDNIEKAIKAGWPVIAESIDFSTGGFCPIVEVDQDGNLNFRLG